MKIRCRITECADRGDKVFVKLQGVEERAAEWRSMSVIEMLIDNVGDIGRRMYVGREIDVEVTPR